MILLERCHTSNWCSTSGYCLFMSALIPTWRSVATTLICPPPPPGFYVVHAALKALPFHGITIVHLTDLNNIKINYFICFLVNHSICAIFSIMARTVTATIPRKPQILIFEIYKNRILLLLSRLIYYRKQILVLESVKCFFTEELSFKDVWREATLVYVAPLSKIDDDSNKFPAAIPSIIG